MKNSKDLRAIGVDEWLIDFRRQRRIVGLTLTEIERMIGVDKTTLAMYEIGDRVCSPAKREAMSRALASWSNPRYRERLQSVRSLWDFSMAAAACMSGVAPGTLQHLESGYTTLPRAGTREKLNAWLERWEKAVPVAVAVEAAE